MSNAILVPGRPDKDEHYDPTLPSNSEDHWFSWLKRQLILRDIHANVIEPPFPTGRDMMNGRESLSGSISRQIPFSWVTAVAAAS